MSRQSDGDMVDVISMSDFQLSIVKDGAGKPGIAMTLFDGSDSWTFGLVQNDAVMSLSAELLRLSAVLPASQKSKQALSDLRAVLSDLESQTN